ncbi:MAG: KH domain-containing protein [Acidimicrobiales bacterium]|nr:MAG: KH domain-containing protein [Acidimicrobiales bacterium]
MNEDLYDHNELDANRLRGVMARDVAEYLAKSVVTRPDAVSVELSDDRDPIKIDVHVDPQDMGRVIGKRGRVAHAIRTLVAAAAAQEGERVEVEFYG